MDRQRRILLAAAGAGVALAATRTACAQLAGTASIISGFPAGGMGDAISRPLAERLRGRYAANVIVEARVGAGGRIAVDYVRRAAPDGLTILQIPSSIMVLYPHIYKKLSYDPLADFIPVTSTATYDISFTAGPGLPAEIRTVADYLRWARANPKLASYGVPAAGSALNFAGMMLRRAENFEFTTVAYKGGAPLLQDLLGGQIPVSFNVLGEVLPHIRAGKLRSLAVATEKRSRFLPDVPTFVELGYKDLLLHEWLGWFLPAKTPAETVRRLNAIVRDGLASPELTEGLATRGLVAIHQSPEDFAALVRREHERWGGIARATGFVAED
ncbi:MAG: twin-arginine translocation pathway signal protein [Burkholderiales bacterium]|nr:twin-arginine translocation pathway signal protein [Burkholderiales bacterium]